jgi:hypothetical protein
MAENPTANDLNATGGIAPQISDLSLPSIAGSMAEGLGSSRERVSERDAKEIREYSSRASVRPLIHLTLYA